MRIAIIINTSWNIYNFRKGLVKQLLKAGHEVHAIAPRDSYSEKLIELGCVYHPLKIKGIGLNPIQDLIFIWQLYTLSKVVKPDIFLGFTIKANIYGSLVSRALRFPMICNISGLGTVFIWKSLVNRMAIWLYRISVRHASFVFFQNDEDQDHFIKKVGIEESLTGLLPGSGVNLKDFGPSEFEPVKHPGFLMVARLIREKGIYEYVEAARITKKEYPDVQFLLIGHLDPDDVRGVKREELNDWVNDGIINYLEPVEDIREIILKAEVLVLPSYREGMPRTLLEGGAMSRILIASDVPGCRHIIREGENGWLCKVKDAQDLAQKIKKYLLLPMTEKSELSRKSRAIVEENFDENIVIESYLEKIDELVGGGNNGADSSILA